MPSSEETLTVSTRRLEVLQLVLLQRLSSMLSSWEQEMQKSGRSLVTRQEQAKKLKEDLLTTLLDLDVYSMTLKDRWIELEGLSFVTGHPLLSIDHIRALATSYKETSPVS